MKDFSPYIFRIQRYSIHDGPGIRTTLFFQGCPLACAWCHNPESQEMPKIHGGPASGSDFPKALVAELVKEIERDRIYFEESAGGVTFSGGEPLCQGDLIPALASACAESFIHTCLDTSGFAPWQALEKAARAVDLILYDIKAVDPGLHKRVTGQSSGLILSNLEALDRIRADVSLRFPLIPGHTDSDENIIGIISFLTRKTGFRKIHILPFHHTARDKYRALNRKDPMAGVRPPEKEVVAAAAGRFKDHGFETIIGG